MRLKRFLLRYDPPGVGLEVEEGGVTGVRHKDLRTASEVRSPAAVQELVDELVAGEPWIPGRHRAALAQLLCRLYQVDPFPDSGAPAPGGRPRSGHSAASESEDEGPAALAADAGAGGLQEGQLVALVGLRGALQVHNGELGTLTKARLDKSRFEVLLRDGRNSRRPEALHMRSPEHIVPVAPSGAFAVGSHAVIRGLYNHVELNGCLCRIVRCHKEAQRFDVRTTDTGADFRMKRENILPVVPCAHVFGLALREAPERAPSPARAAAGEGELFGPGSLVQIVGLKTAMGYNGQTALVLHADQAKGRYGIRLRDGSEKTIRIANVRLLEAAGGAGP